MTEFTTQARRLMDGRGMTLRALARAAYCDPSLLSKVLSGKREPSREMARALDGALAAGGALAAAAAAAAPVSPASAEAVAWAARNPRHPGTGAVDALGGVLAAQRRAEDLVGSAETLVPVLAQLGVVEALAREARGPGRLAAVHMGAQWAQFTGWLHASTGKQGRARMRLSQALEWAVEAGDPDLLSEVLSFQGHTAYMAGQAGPAIGLSQAARRDPGAYPGQLAISAAQEAKGHALEGSARQAERLLDEAGELAALAAARPGEAPPWLYYHTDGFWDLQAGEAYAHLAGRPVYRRRAVESITAGYAALPPGSRGSEWAAEYLVRLAALHVLDGDADAAAEAGARAAAVARATGSLRLYVMLRRLRGQLAERWPGAPQAAALDEALH
jgi:transcriptional regulator with XRE-family HTH domain